MQPPSRPEIYQAFLDFIHAELQRERSIKSRRMISVFFWCFLMPAVVALVLLLLVQFGVFPRKVRGYLDWLMLAFPVFYSIYFLSIEVLRDLPAVFKKGGMQNVLNQSLREVKWRESVCEGMKKSVRATDRDWKWMIENFRIDLANLQYRLKYLTVLAGAVFFLVLKGIDSLVDGEQKTTWVRDSVLGWAEAAGTDFSSLIGLSLFLILIYLSGSQSYQSLLRFLHCAELVHLEKEKSLD